jgi:hypothetical protein
MPKMHGCFVDCGTRSRNNLAIKVDHGVWLVVGDIKLAHVEQVVEALNFHIQFDLRPNTVQISTEDWPENVVVHYHKQIEQRNATVADHRT